MDPRVKRTIFATFVAAVGLTVALFIKYPPTFDAPNLVAFGTLLALSTLAMITISPRHWPCRSRP